MGQWNNADGLPLQFGTAKPLPDWSGEYGLGGSTREVECLIPCVPTTMGGYTMPGVPQSSWASATTYAAAGISNPDLFIPLQVTAVQTSTSSSISITKPQLYIEQISLTVLDGSSASMFAGASSLNVGLVVYNPSSAAFVWATPNSSVHLINALASSVVGLGTTITWYGSSLSVPPAASSATGAWFGQVPQVTNTSTTVPWTPNGAWIGATLTGGTGTSVSQGLLKLRIRYSWNGMINQ
jgi:hypothetical protein